MLASDKSRILHFEFVILATSFLFVFFAKGVLNPEKSGETCS